MTLFEQNFPRVTPTEEIENNLHDSVMAAKGRVLDALGKTDPEMLYEALLELSENMLGGKANFDDELRQQDWIFRESLENFCRRIKNMDRNGSNEVKIELALCKKMLKILLVVKKSSKLLLLESKDNKAKRVFAGQETFY